MYGREAGRLASGCSTTSRHHARRLSTLDTTVSVWLSAKRVHDVDELQQLFVLYDHDGASEVIS